MRAMWVLLVILLLGCVESNPQPSPGGPDVWNAKDRGGLADATTADVVADLVADGVTSTDTTDLHSSPEVSDTIDAVTPPDAVDTCEPPKPFLFEGACVECLASADCADDLHCNPENHRCEVEECDYCESPYPVCVQINGVWSCVQCKYDEDCPAGVPCYEDLHACGPWPSDDYCPPCDSAADCVALNQWLEVDCHSASGCCFDRHGRCDGLSVGCPEGTCVQIWEELGCGTTSDPEELPCSYFPPELGVCTCAEPYLTPRLIGCPDEDCGLGCPGEAACVDPSFVEDFGISIQSKGGICFPVER
jgi:hypothetical protein